MNTMTGAQAIIQTLLQEGVTVIFGYPGGAIMPTYDALHDVQDRLQHVLVRHEQGAVHAAEGYARASGQVGVCIVTSGPGATNLVTGLADALLDSVPVLCITGQVPSALLGTDAFQEVDIIGITASVTKWNYQITRVDDIPTVLAKAFYIATSNRPGPVLIDITKDAQWEQSPFVYKKHAPPLLRLSDQQCDAMALQQAATLINQAKKPYLLVGHGVLMAEAEQEIMQLATKADIPVACTLLGLSAFPTSHRLYVGLLGMHGNYGSNRLTNEADLLIAVGMRFDDRVTGQLASYAKQAKVIHLDIDPAEINKNVQADVALLGDAKIILPSLIAAVHVNQHADWLKEFVVFAEKEYAAVIAKELAEDSASIKMAEVVQHLSKQTQGQAYLVTDVGQHQMVAARYYAFQRVNSHITSGGLGTMGFALPAAIGVQKARPDDTVIAVMGDGGFQMTIQELAVLTQENLPIKMVILNNSNLGMVRQWQELFFEQRYSCTALKNPDFITIAQGYGIQGRRVYQRSQLADAVRDMLHAKTAYLLEVVVENQEMVFPMIPAGAGVSEIRLS